MEIMCAVNSVPRVQIPDSPPYCKTGTAFAVLFCLSVLGDPQKHVLFDSILEIRSFLGCMTGFKSYISLLTGSASHKAPIDVEARIIKAF